MLVCVRIHTRSIDHVFGVLNPSPLEPQGLSPAVHAEVGIVRGRVLLSGCLLDVYWLCVQTDGQLFRNVSVHDMMSFKEPLEL